MEDGKRVVDESAPPATRRFAVDFLPGVTTQLVEDKALANPARDSAIELGAAARRFIEAVVSAELPPQEIVEISEAIQDVASRLERVSRGSRAAHLVDDPEAGVRMFNPAVGLANPVAPPVHLYEDPIGTELGWLEFNRVHEGVPGHAHGGFTALVLDQLMTRANGLAGRAGVTLRLEVEYHRVVPLRERLAVSAEVTERKGRKIWARAWITKASDPDVYLASATGLFLELPAGRLAELFERQGG